MKDTFKKKLLCGLSLAVCAIAVAVPAFPAYADNLPGAGKTVRYAQGDSLGGNYVVVQIVSKALKQLGYTVKLTTMNTTLFFQAAAQGDEDLATDVNFPQREPGFKAVEAQAVKVGTGAIEGGGINGYLIDKKSADEYHITNLSQFQDPTLAARFGDHGVADLVSCDPGWSCGDVVDFQLNAFGLKKTVRSVRGKYEALTVNAMARLKQGKPTIFYAWSPSWITNALVPGKDVVWLPTPSDALPPNVPNKGSALVAGVKGCAANADPCRMAMAQWNWGSVANKDFIAKNPAVKALIEEIKFPIATWSNWEYEISKNGGSSAEINKLADAWLAANGGQLDQWVKAAAIQH